MALTFKFNADGSSYKRGLERMRQDTKQFAGGMKGLLGGIFAGLGLAAFKGWADSLDRIHKLSLRLDKTTDSLQRIGYAAELNGTTLETLANALTKVEQNAGQAHIGLKSYKDAFARLGIDTEEFINLKPEDQIVQLAEAYQQAREKGTGVADILLILGGRAKEVLPLLSQTPEELKRVFEEAHVASDNTINKMVEWNDKWTTIKSTIAGFLSWFVDAFQAVATVIGAYAGLWLSTFMAFYDAISTGAKAAGNAVMNGLTRNFKAVETNIAQMKAAYKKFFEDIKNGATAANETLTEEIGKIYGVGDNKRPNERNLPDAPTNRGVDTGEIHGPEEAKETKNKKTPEQVQAEKDKLDLEAAKKREARIDEANLLDSLDDQGKVDYLKNKQNKLFKDSKENPFLTEDERINMRAEAKELAPQIKSLQDQLASSMEPQAAVLSSSLASIGGGGGTAVISNDPALAESKKQTNLLEKIANKFGADGVEGKNLEGTPEL